MKNSIRSILAALAVALRVPAIRRALAGSISVRKLEAIGTPEYILASARANVRVMWRFALRPLPAWIDRARLMRDILSQRFETGRNYVWFSGFCCDTGSFGYGRVYRDESPAHVYRAIRNWENGPGSDGPSSAYLVPTLEVL